LPQAVTEDEDRFRSAGPSGRNRRRAGVFLIRKRPAQQRRAAEDLEEAFRHLDTRDGRTTVPAAQRGLCGPPRRQRFEGIVVGDPIVNVAGRRSLAQTVLRNVRLPHHHQLFRAGIRQGFQNDGVNQGEQRRRRCHAEAEQQRHRQRKSRRAHQRSKRACEVLSGAGD
jgi:hypothetical protein